MPHPPPLPAESIVQSFFVVCLRFTSFTVFHFGRYNLHFCQHLSSRSQCLDQIDADHLQAFKYFGTIYKPRKWENENEIDKNLIFILLKPKKKPNVQHRAGNKLALQMQLIPRVEERERERETHAFGRKFNLKRQQQNKASV